MPQIEFAPLGGTTSQVGFGCGTLIGRATFSQAAKLVETALDLGIRYFDTAPNYGMGTAEEVLGAVIGNAADVVIATKVGYPRAVYSARRNLVRKYCKPVLDYSRGLKTLARRFYARPQKASSRSAAHGPATFAAEAVRRSLDTSLALLRRPCVDVFLAHDPDDEALDAPTRQVFETLRVEGLIRCFGAALSGQRLPSNEFGRVWQSSWPPLSDSTCPADHACIYHGVIRTAEKLPSGATRLPARTLLREATAQQPKALFLVATSTPAKLKDIVSELG
jgi:aryl-alcohol dehydrogenase-like predicted oxidoreductase